MVDRYTDFLLTFDAQWLHPNNLCYTEVEHDFLGVSNGEIGGDLMILSFSSSIKVSKLPQWFCL